MYILKTTCPILAKAQKEHHEKKEKAKLARTQIDFVGGSATKRPIPAVAINPGRVTHKSLYIKQLICYSNLHV